MLELAETVKEVNLATLSFFTITIVSQWRDFRDWSQLWLWMSIYAAHQPCCGDHHGGEHTWWSSSKEARHHKSKGVARMGTKDQVEGWTSSHGGWFPNQTRSPEKKLSLLSMAKTTSDGWSEEFSRECLEVWEETVLVRLGVLCSLLSRSLYLE